MILRYPEAKLIAVFAASAREVVPQLNVPYRVVRNGKKSPFTNSLDMNNHHHTLPASDDGHRGRAPWMQVPARSVAVVEHPCVVKNLDKGVVSLGGSVKLSKVGRRH